METETDFCSPESVPQDCVERLLIGLATSDPAKFALFSGSLRRRFPDEVLRAWVFHIGAPARDSSTEHALQCASDRKYFALLLDPDFLPLDRAIRAALVLRDSDRQFFARFAAIDTNVGHGDSQHHLGRALDVLEGIGGFSVLLSWLRILTNHENEHIK
ncbi:MAG: hypothetical protein M3Y27_14180, partial [Acidobacteriota bacterium]|nr:hypothetical protein [Acidobacteriota bacterium]